MEKSLKERHVQAILQLHDAKAILDEYKEKMDLATENYNNAITCLEEIEKELGIIKVKEKSKEPNIKLVFDEVSKEHQNTNKLTPTFDAQYFYDNN